MIQNGWTVPLGTVDHNDVIDLVGIEISDDNRHAGQLNTLAP
jgi:hypothetical protein